MTPAQSSTPRAALCMAAVGLLALACHVALAADARVASLPITFRIQKRRFVQLCQVEPAIQQPRAQMNRSFPHRIALHQ
jgi:hypothetical protein